MHAIYEKNKKIYARSPGRYGAVIQHHSLHTCMQIHYAIDKTNHLRCDRHIYILIPISLSKSARKLLETVFSL